MDTYLRIARERAYIAGIADGEANSFDRDCRASRFDSTPDDRELVAAAYKAGFDLGRCNAQIQRRSA